MEEFECTSGRVFESMDIWRSKVQNDLKKLPTTGGNDDLKISFLLEQGKDCEQAIYGSLKEGLFDVNECVNWGLYPASKLEAQRTLLYEQAALELNNCKQLCNALAHEHGIHHQYADKLKRSVNHTLSDYEYLGELQFALLVFETNLKLHLSLAADPEEVEQIFRDGYLEGLKLVRRTAQQSLLFWTRTTHAADPRELDIQTAFAKATLQIRMKLLKLGEQHGVEAQFLEDALFNIVDCPTDVSLEEGWEDDNEADEAKAPRKMKRYER